ncbi:hypothetical protein K4K59_004161 [Colletotrichum sp. SAR11_240]|nr:hypothetical protein K4K59_004161 [Colletotrichum sp. SAR11_240]
MRIDVSRRHLKHSVLFFDGYRRELDIALIEAANADAHSIEMMEFLLAAGANINAEMNDQYVGQVWRNALDEEVPSLFRAKVEFLVERGVDTSRVWSWQGPLTSAEFFLKKPLQTALKQHLSRKLLKKPLVTLRRTEDQGPEIIDGHASKLDSVDKESLPEAILRLADLREEWLAENCSKM